jgi:hypothetical protein
LPKSFTGFGAAALIALGITVDASSADAQSVMKQCGDHWQAAKAAGTTNGLTWQQFLALFGTIEGRVYAGSKRERVSLDLENSEFRLCFCEFPIRQHEPIESS